MVNANYKVNFFFLIHRLNRQIFGKKKMKRETLESIKTLSQSLQKE